MKVHNLEFKLYMGNITQAQIAVEIGVSAMTVSRWLNHSELNPLRYERLKRAVDKIRERENELLEHHEKLLREKECSDCRKTNGTTG